MKISMNNVLNVAKKIPMIFAFGIVIYICSQVEDERDCYYEWSINPIYGFTYGVAFNALMSSNMFDHQKTQLIGIIRKDADSDYYESVCRILSSDMLGINKIKTIAALSR